MILPAKEWKLEKFMRSDRPTKKVVAILRNGERTRKIHFGQRGSSTYHDLTKVGGDPVHNDKKRREAYRTRHTGEGDISKKWSPGFLSYHYLWIAYFICSYVIN